MRNFHHRGSLGDIIYSLPTIISFGGGILYLRKQNHFDLLNSILKKQPYIKDVICETKLKPGEFPIHNYINLNIFRSIHKKNPNTHLAQCHLIAFNKQYDLSKIWLLNIEALHKKNIIVNRTWRYRDKILNWNILKSYQNECLFIGTNAEYLIFKKETKLDIDFYWCKDVLEFASIIKGSKLFIGNQSVGFALAESLKHPRILEQYLPLNNCLPHTNNGHLEIEEKLIQFYLNQKIILAQNIPIEHIKNSIMLNTIFSEHNEVVFLPNFGEFGSTINKGIKTIHFVRAKKKIVCCKKGEEALYPSANEFFYDWNDIIDDKYKWGFFTKIKLSDRINTEYDECIKRRDNEVQHIKTVLGNGKEYIAFENFNYDKIFDSNPYAHLFKFKLEPKQKLNLNVDVVISPRYRQSRPHFNFSNWDNIIEKLNEKNLVVGSIGSKDQSLKLSKSKINSWDYFDNLSAIIEMLQNCKLYVGLDTGVSYIACFMNIPTIIFSHANNRYYRTDLLSKLNSNYFLDLGKNVQDISIITNAIFDFMK